MEMGWINHCFHSEIRKCQIKIYGGFNFLAYFNLHYLQEKIAFLEKKKKKKIVNKMWSYQKYRGEELLLSHNNACRRRKLHKL